jgi:hypothetical protein
MKVYVFIHSAIYFLFAALVAINEVSENKQMTTALNVYCCLLLAREIVQIFNEKW